MQVLSQVVAEAGSAGASETRDILVIGGVVSAGFVVAALLGLGQRLGRPNLLSRISDAVGRLLDLPGWAAIPVVVALSSMATVYFGYMWDASIHMNNGRDSGPFGNVSHYPMMLGLYGILAAGVLGVLLPKPGLRPGPASIRVSRSWYIPIGSLLLLVCGFFAFLGFPLDEVWHRLFGQDVTIWGPTHVLMLSGAILSILGVSILISEATGPGWRPLPQLQDRFSIAPDRAVFLVRAVLMGVLLVGFSALLAEYDLGAPLFQLWLHPGLIALFAATAFVAARVWTGRAGAALVALALFLGVRGVIFVIVGPVLGQSSAMFPLMVAEAVVVEACAFVWARRPLVLGVISGLGIGTIGFATEWLWVDATFPVPWTSPMLGQGLTSAIVMGVAGGVLGALLASGLAGQLPSARSTRAAMVCAVAAGIAVMANGLWPVSSPAAEATVSVRDVSVSDGVRQSTLRVQFPQPNALGEPMYVGVLAYQGGPPLVSQPLVSLGNGAYRTSGTVPIGAQWKTVLRVNTGRAITVLPVYLPEDSAIPADEVPAPAEFTRPLADKSTYLLREMRQDASAGLYAVSLTVVLGLIAVFLIFISIGIGRYSRSHGSSEAAGVDPALLH